MPKEGKYSPENLNFHLIKEIKQLNNQTKFTSLH